MYSDSTFLYTIYTHFIHILYFFFTLPPTTNIYTLSLHDALPISRAFLEIENVISVDISWKPIAPVDILAVRSEEHTSELQSLRHLVCRLLLEKKKKKISKKDID